MISNLKKNLIAFLLLLFIWQIISMTKIINPMFMPSPLETIIKGIQLIMNKKIFIDMAYSYLRISYGILLAILAGIPAGLLLGYFGKIYIYFDCIIDFFRSIPPVLTFPLALLIFGVGEESRIAVIFFGAVFIMVLNTALGVYYSKKIRINTAKIMGAKWYQVILRIAFFDALPQIFVGLRVSLSMGIIIGIVTEMLVGAKYGLGSRVVYAQTAYDTPEMYFTIIIVGISGFILNKLLVFLEKKTVHWNQYNEIKILPGDSKSAHKEII